MNPPIEDLLDARSTPSSRLVTLGAMRARQINSYFGQLGEGLGSAIPPQVTSMARKPLSIAFEEIAADKIVARRIPSPSPRSRSSRPTATPRPTPTPSRSDGHHDAAGARRSPHRPRGHRRHRRLQGRRGLPSPGRRRRPRGARPDRGRHALRRRDHLLGAGLRAGADLAVGRAPTPSRTPASARAPT